MEENTIVKRDPKTFRFNFDLPRDQCVKSVRIQS